MGDIYPTTSAATADLNNPNFAFRRGLFGNDVPYSYRASGVYELPYQISVSATGAVLQGFPGTDDGVGRQQHGGADARRDHRSRLSPAARHVCRR